MLLDFTSAFWEVVVLDSALVALDPVKVLFARALASADITHPIMSSIDVALTSKASRVTIVTISTPANAKRHSDGQTK